LELTRKTTFDAGWLSGTFSTDRSARGAVAGAGAAFILASSFLDDPTSTCNAKISSSHGFQREERK